MTATAQLRRILPEHEPIRIDQAHPIFHTFFDVENIYFPHPLVAVTPVYYGLFEGDDPRTAIVRLEQLYPFPGEPLVKRLKAMPALEELVWAQEEPKNMGAWSFIFPRLEEVVGQKVRYAGRGRAGEDHQAELDGGGRRQGRHGENGKKRGISSTASTQNIRFSGRPMRRKSVKR